MLEVEEIEMDLKLNLNLTQSRITGDDGMNTS